LSVALILSAEAILSTFLFLYLGVVAPFLLLGKSAARLTVLAAVAAGITFWSFVDLMNDAALLGVNQGFTGGFTHFLLASLFALTLVGWFWLDQRLDRGKGRSRVTLTYATALLVALGIGLHSLGEGVEVGSLIGYAMQTNPTSSSLVNAIGGFGSGAAYLLHKFLEGFVVGVFAIVAKARFGRNVLLGLLAGTPTMIGLMLAFVMPVDATVFFAIGAGVAVYIEYKLLPTLGGQKKVLVYIFAMLVGFYLMYLAGLFHSYTAIF
jgi:zinc transporter ZupT